LPLIQNNLLQMEKKTKKLQNGLFYC